jgi:hypothetical protein
MTTAERQTFITVNRPYTSTDTDSDLFRWSIAVSDTYRMECCLHVGMLLIVSNRIGELAGREEGRVLFFSSWWQDVL